MNKSFIPPIIYKILGIKNVAGEQINPATEEKQDAIIANQEMRVLLRSILSMLQLPRNHDQANNADRISIVAGSVGLATNQTLQTLASFNGVQAHQMSVAAELTAWQNCCRSTII